MSFSRRNFVKSASVGLAGMGLISQGIGKEWANRSQSGPTSRRVNIATLTMNGIKGDNIEQVIAAALKRMEIALPMAPDIYCLPEVFHAAAVKGGRPPLPVSSENGSGNIIAPFQTFAKAHNCYIVCPVYTTADGKYYNAAVLIDRQGEYLGEYRKARLTEGELRKGLTPGPSDIPVFATDFGRIGVQICFDIEWPEGWNQLGKKGAEIVFFPSAFSGGKRIAAKALDNKYCIVSSIRDTCSRICDVTGELAVSGGHPSNEWGVFGSINLERAILHTHGAGTVAVKFPEIRKKYGTKIVLHTLGEEHYTILESLTPEIKVADILREFDMRTHADHLRIAEELTAGLGF
jgi:Predicted amidohydrolase